MESLVKFSPRTEAAAYCNDVALSELIGTLLLKEGILFGVLKFVNSSVDFALGVAEATSAAWLMVAADDFEAATKSGTATAAARKAVTAPAATAISGSSATAAAIPAVITAYWAIV